jgi:hypothetical protein
LYYEIGRHNEPTLYVESGERHELIEWIATDFAMDRGESFMLLSQVAECRCTQFVNPLLTYVCKVDRRFLPPRAASG